MTISQEQLDAWRSACRKVTGGEWEIYEPESSYITKRLATVYPGGARLYPGFIQASFDRDVEFILAAHVAMLTLIEEVTLLQGECADLQARLAQAQAEIKERKEICHDCVAR